MAVAIRQAATYDQLLLQWQAQGWSQLRNVVLNPVPVGIQSGKVLIPTMVDAFEWKDVSAFGVALSQSAVDRLQGYIRQGGSELHAWALFKHVDVDFLGVRVTSYRLVLFHSIVQLGAAVVLILVAAFAALLFVQYQATGTPPIQAIQQLWSGIVRPVNEAVSGTISQATQGFGSVYILATLAAGAIAIAFAQAGKTTGSKISPPKGPSASIGARSGGLSVRASS